MIEHLPCRPEAKPKDLIATATCTSFIGSQPHSGPSLRSGRQKIEIVPATLCHAHGLRLREGDALEVAAFGLTKEQAIAQSMARSLWAETYLIDGEPAAIVGLGLSSFVGGHGVPWLLTGPACERCKRRFMGESRRQVARKREA